MLSDQELIVFAVLHGHVVSMTIEWSPVRQLAGEPAESVGTCQCGWTHREPRQEPFLDYARAMDVAIEEHWRAEKARERGEREATTSAEAV